MKIMDKVNKKQDNQKVIETCVKRSHKDVIWEVAWSTSGLLLASCSSDKSFKIWSYNQDTSQLKLETTLDGLHTKTISCIAWSQDTQKIAVGSFDATISIWLKK